MKIELLKGSDAEKLIEDPLFRQRWRSLFEITPWASVFQSPDFVLPWLETYRHHYTALVIRGCDTNGELKGLFMLAIHNSSGELSVMGDKLAEYQAWLADPQDGNTFIESALDKLSEAYPSRKLTLLFMLPSVPVDWADQGSRWKDRCYVKSMPRGLMEVGDGAGFKDTLRKKKQSKVNRLKRLGNLHLDRIEAPEELGKVFDEVILFQTLRLKAIYNLSEVPNDPLMKDYYLKLIQRPRMIHATALRVDDNLVSAQIHMYNREQVLLGLITHSPFYAKYSPGELHILMTGVELGKEQIPIFDLTPGGRYKERYATHYDEVHVIVVFFRRAACFRYKLTRSLAEIFKSNLQKIGITPEKARDLASTLLDFKRKWQRMKPIDLLAAAMQGIRRKVRYLDEIRVYSFNLDFIQRLPAAAPMMKDQVAHLLAYQPREAGQPPINRFMKQALDRLEDGHHVYTLMNDQNLVQYGWLMEPPQGKPLTIEGHEVSLPAQSVLLNDFYTESLGACLPLASLAGILHDAGSIFGAKQAYIMVENPNRELRAIVENAGFTYEYSLFNKKVFGNASAWSTNPAISNPAEGPIVAAADSPNP